MGVVPYAEAGEASESFGLLQANQPFGLESAVFDGVDTITITITNGRIRWGDTTFELNEATGETDVTQSPVAASTTYYVYVDYNAGAPQIVVSTTAPSAIDADHTVLGSVTTAADSSVDTVADLRGFLTAAAPRLPDGSSTVPALAFANGSGIGMYRHVDGHLVLATNSVDRYLMADNSGDHIWYDLTGTEQMRFDHSQSRLEVPGLHSSGEIRIANNFKVTNGGTFVKFGRESTNDHLVLAAQDNIYFEGTDATRWASLNSSVLDVNGSITALNITASLHVRFDSGTIQHISETGAPSSNGVEISANGAEYWFANGHFGPEDDGVNDCGWSNRAWEDVHTYNLNELSDARIKEDIRDSDLGLDFIRALKPRAYRMIEGRSGRFHYGLVAQEVKQTLDDLGVEWAGHVDPTVNPKFTDDNGDPITDRQEIRYSELHAPTIKAIQELADRLEALENA